MGKSFFSTENFKDKTGAKGKPLSCASCGLYRHKLNPKIEPYGNGQKKVMWLGEAPGEQEDRKGKPWQGKIGQALRTRLKDKYGFDLFRDAICINALGCRPTDEKENNRAPNSNEIACCRKHVLKTIDKYKPHLIILSGGSAVESLIGHRWKKNLEGIYKWRGWTIPDREYQAWICPIFHPSFVEQSNREIETIFDQDIDRALSMIDVPFPEFQDERNQVEIITDREQIGNSLLAYSLGQTEYTAFDYETTGRKPHAKGHRIVCMSIAAGGSHAQVFMWPTKQDARVQLKRFLASKQTYKMAHNMAFENIWSRFRVGHEVRNWGWDSMLAAHILDNRPGITGLKFQSYVHFGICDYDSEIEPYLKATDDKNGNALNRIMELADTKEGEEKLMIYCGMDSLLEHKLAMKQMKKIGWG